MAPRKKKEENPPIVEQSVRMATETMINDFMKDHEKTELTFPADFTNTERRYVHEYVKKYGLKSKSHGKGQSRILTVFKQTKNTQLSEDLFLDCTGTSRNTIYQLLKENPLSFKEKCDLKKPLKANLNSPKLFPYRISVGQMNAPHLQIPPYPSNLAPATVSQRMSLPIFPYRSKIIETIRNSRAVVISGETGSGKTTQVPQYILEDGAECRVPYRIICTQPRRLSAISISERVAQERNEKLGSTVGYQIRLESKISPSTNLIYCTNGVLLRCLMSDKPEVVFKYITHVIVDEVHERDKFSDFLLISLKRAMQAVPHIKVILMSATIDSEIFTKYFFECPLIEVPGKMFDVQLNYLEDVLVEIGYTNERIEQMRRSLKADATITDPVKRETQVDSSEKLLSAIESVNLDDDTREFADEVLSALLNGDDESMEEQFIYLIAAENLDVDYFHTEYNVTALMIATAKGSQSFIQVLLEAGANPDKKNRAGKSAMGMAKEKGDAEIVQLLLPYSGKGEDHKVVKSNPLEEKKLATMLLDGYLAENMEDTIDHNLLCKLISHIHRNKPNGSILVFLPGYADILEQAEKIQTELNANEYRLFMLHSNMQTGDQKGVFNRMTGNIRKIVLATNLAETSITIDDVVYVIDSGRVKQQTFDAISGSSQLAVCWCSKACAKQRAGRAGRCQAGICYRLYSSTRFDTMEGYTLPELLRVPLTEICIQAKLIETELTIGQFLEEAIQPPSSFNVKQSIQILQAIGALDEEENITDLGLRLGDLPIDVRLGKMLLYGIMLRCLDPVLTIVSALSTSDPFTLPTQSFERGKVMGIKRHLSEDSFSDHLLLLRIYQKWSREKTMRNERRFCQQNYLRYGTLDMISGVRSQILGQLRSIGFIRPYGPGNIRDLNQHSSSWAMVKACIVAGLYPNIAHVDRKKGIMKSRNVTKMGIHMSSVVKQRSTDKRDSFDKLPTDWIVYEEKVRISRFCLTQTNTVVTPMAVALFAGSLALNENKSLVPYTTPSEDDSSEEDEISNRYRFLIDDWLNFVCDTQTAFLIFNFKQKLSAQFLRFLSDSRDYFKKAQNNIVLEALSKILADEEAAYYLPKLKDIDEKPRANQINYEIIKNQTENIRTSTPVSTSESQQRQNNQQPSPSQTSHQQQHHANQRGRHQRQSQQQIQQQPSRYNNKPRQNSSKNTSSVRMRCFIVKAASREQVVDCVRNGRWDFSSSIRSQLIRMARQSKNAKIYILFSVPLSKFLCCLSEFYLDNDQIAYRLIDERQFNFSYLRNVLNGSNLQYSKHLDEFLDGEEIPQEIATFYYNLIVK
ncbi:3'-5' RNA helicase YTHDC2-like [Culicoides brevitarsis]|uniref:3'-5' RNA helicase YTHDC2-like n=1 Tax=Culicoides brevitarsis TaxID=469753 RepID=UPI00307CAE86